jgi:hydroxylamine dehydrogenase
MRMKYVLSIVVFLAMLFISVSVVLSKEDDGKISEKMSPQTLSCIGCHTSYTPGIVKDWMHSRHAKTTPADALKAPALERRISAASVKSGLSEYNVGCYECHSLNAEKHKDNFDHMGFRINVVVSPNDCNVCHPKEVKEYSGSKKANAYGNIMKNPVYHALVSTVTGLKKIQDGKVVIEKPTDNTLRETCLACHGTVVEVTGTKTVSTKMGDIKVPQLANWPNQGVGRINPDGSIGACSPCHPRHAFSIEVARKPYTCAQCHLEPDVPAWNVYKESKHGNIFFSKEREWNFNAVPWKVGKDFTAPTCATCHNSLITAPDGSVLIERNHDFGARLWVRLFGLVYSHPQPKSGNTTIIKNKDGLPLPTTFVNEPALEHLIGKEEQDKRFRYFRQVCSACHNTDWIDGHFDKLNTTIKEADAMTLAATLTLVDAWTKGVEKGLPTNDNPFDEPIEQMWIRQWLFYGNSLKYASAMTGAPDYAAFHDGWWNLTSNLMHMRDMVDLKYKMSKVKE